MTRALTALEPPDQLGESGKSEVYSRPSQGLKELPSGSGVPLDELADEVDRVRALVKSGEVRLEVVVSPWGLEFNIVSARGV
jgi:hypothetical protein